MSQELVPDWKLCGSLKTTPCAFVTPVTAGFYCQGVSSKCGHCSKVFRCHRSFFFLLVWASTAARCAKAQGRGLPHLPRRPHADHEDVNGSTESLSVDRNKFKHSVHGRMFHCVDCHTDVKSLAHETPPQKVSCAQCHADAQAAYAHSVHAKASKAGQESSRHLRGLPRRCA